mgnify:CR=1 FL=1
MAFTRNGRDLGVAFRDLNSGEYLPAGSLFTDPAVQEEPAELKFNFGAGPASFFPLPPRLGPLLVPALYPDSPAPRAVRIA